ncbi:hypothetical protein LguiB_035224 [Lonicera macranthoides]
MERFRRRRKSRTSTSIEGTQKTQKHNSFPSPVSESHSGSHGTTKEDSLIFETRRSSSERATGTPMKKLLADEMSKETEAKRRSPSVIARLMGLDGMPSQQPVHRQQKRLSDSYQETIGFRKNGELFEGRSNRKCSMEQHNFKDVYEDLEASHVTNRRYSSRLTTNLKLPKPEISSIHQKFTDLKEFHDTDETGHSSKDLLLKFLQQPDSMYAKHINDRQGNSSGSLCSHIAGSKPQNSANAKGWKSERETLKKRVTGSQRRDCLLNYALKSLEPEEKCEAETLPAKIVILKPNVWKLCNDVKAISSSGTIVRDYQLNRSKHPDYSSVGKDLPKGVDFSKQKSREAREIAKEVTRQMKEAFGSGRRSSSYSGIRGYAGDESSFNMSESDSESEKDFIALTYRNSSELSNRHWPLSSGSTESSVSREAKKRLSARWKSANKYQYEQVVGKGSTLGEMLAIPEREMKPEILDSMVDLQGTRDGFAGYGGTAEGGSPLGISSRDGLKDRYIRNSSRSRSVPPCGSRNHKTSAPREALVDDRLAMPKEGVHRGRSKEVKGNSNQKEHCLSKNLSSRNKKYHSSRHRYACSTVSLPDMVDKNEPSEPAVSQVPSSDSSTSSIVGSAVNSEHEHINVASASSDELLPMLTSDDSSTCHQEDSNSQRPSAVGPSEGPSVVQSPELEPESSESSKEADHQSPVSVLEVPSTEDVSSGSECFERVSAGLRELRMQIQRLKMESQVYTEVPMVDAEDAGQGSIILSEEKGLVTFSSWESSYIVDLLIESGFNDTKPDTFTRTWYSQDCPLGPWIFNNLENKYTDESTGLRFERKLLFDRINLAFVEIFEPSINSFPWVKRPTVGIGLKLQKHGIEFELHKVLERQEKEAYEDITEKSLDRETQWVDLGEGIDEIGMEIEILLIDELITELVTM